METAPTPVPPRPSWVVWLGLAVVLVAAAVLSFDALRGLALAVSIPAHFAWLLPVAVDAGAAVSCATWLGGRSSTEAARYAGRMTWALLAVTVLGNAGQLGMHAHGIAPPWWVAVLVGSIPPAIVGATVHLVVLLVRRPVPAAVTAVPAAVPAVPPAVPAVPAEPEHGEHEDEHGEHGDEDEVVTDPDPVRADDATIVAWLRDNGVPSRRQLAKRYVCGPDRYARLAEQARTLEVAS